MSLLMVGLAVVAFFVNWYMFVPEHTTASGTIQGLGTDVIPKAARLAAYTAVPLALLFMLLDRLRPQGLWLWAVAFVWGGLVATAIAAPINTWASSHLSIIGDGDPATSTRGAVFIAPYVEEAAKATIVFWLAILLRNRIVTRLSTIALAGLAGSGFAFVENIVYYGRVYRYVATTSGTGVDAQQAMNQLAVMRGGMTFFAHPLFTIMTGLGLAVALRARSRSVRILAPVSGYLLAALLHMIFNATASSAGQAGTMLWFIALSVVGAVAGLVINDLRRERALVVARLTDYVRAGWLPDTDPENFSRVRRRASALWHAAWTGPATWWATLRLQQSMTDLAYLRDSIHRGLVDETGQLRESELLGDIGRRRPAAIVAATEPVPYPWRRWRGRIRLPWQTRPVTWPGAGSNSAGDGGLGSSGTGYSPVDPRWGPPRQ